MSRTVKWLQKKEPRSLSSQVFSQKMRCAQAQRKPTAACSFEAFSWRHAHLPKEGEKKEEHGEDLGDNLFEAYLEHPSGEHINNGCEDDKLLVGG